MSTLEMIHKIASVKMCLMSHPDNEPNSEFADRIEDLQEIEDELKEYQKVLEEILFNDNE